MQINNLFGDPANSELDYLRDHDPRTIDFETSTSHSHQSSNEPEVVVHNAESTDGEDLDVSYRSSFLSDSSELASERTSFVSPISEGSNSSSVAWSELNKRGRLLNQDCGWWSTRDTNTVDNTMVLGAEGFDGQSRSHSLSSSKCNESAGFSSSSSVQESVFTGDANGKIRCPLCSHYKISVDNLSTIAHNSDNSTDSTNVPVEYEGAIHVNSTDVLAPMTLMHSLAREIGSTGLPDTNSPIARTETFLNYIGPDFTELKTKYSATPVFLRKFNTRGGQR